MRQLRAIDRYFIGYFFHWHLYRMLFLEFLPYFIGGVVVVLIFMGGNAILFNMLEHIVSKHVPPAVYAKVLVLQAPTFLVMGLPMATIFGVLMSFGRMARDNELDAMRTSWVVAWRILIFMIVVIGLPICAMDWHLIHKVVPDASRQSLDIWKKYLIQDITGRPMSNVFFQSKPGTYFFISSFDPNTGWLNGVMVYSTVPENPFPRLVTAPFARWDEKYVTLQNGRIYDVKKDGGLRFDSTFSMMKINVQQEIAQIYQNLDDSIHAGYTDPQNPQKVAKPDLFKTKSLETDLMFNLSMNMDARELEKQIDTYKHFGMDATSLETNLNFKKSIPFSCLVCMILAVPVSIGGSRAGQGVMTNIVLILILMTCYYISTIVTIAMGHSGSIQPWFAAWGQNIVFSILGVGLAIWYMRK